MSEPDPLVVLVLDAQEAWHIGNDPASYDGPTMSEAIAAALRAHPDAVLAALGYEEIEWEWSSHGIGDEAALAHWQELPSDPADLRLFARKATP